MEFPTSLTGAAQTISSLVADEAAHAAEGTSALSSAIENLERAPVVIGLDVLCILIATIIGYIGVAVMTYGALRGVWDFIMCTGKGEHRLPMIRINLGKHLALGLEFLVGKDIVESIVHPTWDDLGKLGAIIVLRTVVTIFLSRELKEVQEELKVEEQELQLQEHRRVLKSQGA